VRVFDYSVDINEKSEPVMFVTFEVPLVIGPGVPTDLRYRIIEMISEYERTKDDKLG
jgi:hypothetical protein